MDRAGSGCCRWLPAYLRWYLYAFATTFLRRGTETVPMKQPARAQSGTVGPA